MLLENLTSNRATDKAAGEAAVEERAVSIVEGRGEDALNEVRDQARLLAEPLGRAREFTKLDAIIASILGTRATRKPLGAAALALSRGYDHRRIELFDTLAAALRARVNREVRDVVAEGAARAHFSLMESYFSNYIEGTKFSIDEAVDIVLRGKPVLQRPKDSKDIVGVYNQANDREWRNQTLTVGAPILDQLRKRHADMMAARPEAGPGEFKSAMNYAGNTEFVRPEHVAGTLIEGSQRLGQVPAGFARALMAHFLVAEVHPFADGNGRLSRLVMNAELSAAGLCRIIVPTISRDDYLSGLRLMTREGPPDPLIRYLEKIQKWTASFDYASFEALESAMRQHNAFEEDTHEFRLEWPPEIAREAQRAPHAEPTRLAAPKQTRSPR